MAIFLCLGNGDFDLSGNTLSLTDGPQEVLQLIRDNLRFFKGEEPLNLSLGVPYFQQILNKQTPLTTAQALLRSVVANTDGVLEVLNFSLDLDRDTRGATVTFAVTTDGGPVTATESIP